ncbi:hypothetical protein SAMN04488066_10177 [Halorubrum aquaticum]|uniref:Uncharacterized protein n=1 Tax=Halorubrum aquaticum TaxID=387340 RepID=A0A1I2Z074_9EURY|nr:hypothetical protein [Halorubrum aquaticum]SFH30939.1 hypothetical protein SAMN04488066_10177 [Halorubrum aquaticum]
MRGRDGDRPLANDARATIRTDDRVIVVLLVLLSAVVLVVLLYYTVFVLEGLPEVPPGVLGLA